MKLRALFPHLALATTLLAVSILPAQAQNFEFGGGTRLNMMPVGLNMGGPARFGTIDPGTRNLMGLLGRSDVRNELLITSRQREALEATQKEGRAAPLRIEARSDVQPNSEEFSKRLTDQIKEQVEGRNRERNKKVQSLLSAKQAQRLQELDLQWRGPLAVADDEMEKQIGLNPEQKTEADKLLGEYRAAMSKATMDAMRDLNLIQEQKADDTDAGGNRQVRIGIVMRAPDPKKMTPEEKDRLIKRDKEIEAARKEFSDKALALLTPEQKSAWKRLQGTAFNFRQNEY